MTEAEVYRDSVIDGNRHIVRLTHIATHTIVEIEGKLPLDRRQEADVRKATRDRAWELLRRKIEK